jgi:hypothetical protein
MASTGSDAASLPPIGMSGHIRNQHKTIKTHEDGFCRQVDGYDGQVIRVEGREEYELGNYLGGGVAGVVYEALRLRPPSEYYEAPMLSHIHNEMICFNSISHGL